MKEVARTGGGRALVLEALRIVGATVGQTLVHDGTEFVPADAPATGIPEPSGPEDGDVLVRAGGAWTAVPGVGVLGTALAAALTIDGQMIVRASGLITTLLSGATGRALLAAATKPAARDELDVYSVDETNGLAADVEAAAATDATTKANAAAAASLPLAGGTLTGDLTLATTKRLLAGVNVLVGAVADKLSAAHLAIAGQTIGDQLVADSSTSFARVAAVAAGRLWRATGVGAAPAWSTLTIPDTAARGTVLVASAANTVTALDAKTANYFLVGDGTDLLSLAPAAARAAMGAPALSRLYLPSTPVLRWPCSETSGTTLANLGSFVSADLTVAGSPDLGVPTEIGSAIRWTGSSAASPVTEYATGGSGLTNPATTLTIYTWVKVRAFGNAYAKLVLWLGRSTWGTGGIEGVGLRLAGGAEAGVGAGGWRAMLVTGTAGAGTQTSLDGTGAKAHRRLTLDRWHLVAMTYDGSALRTYLDGYLTASTAVSGAIDYGSTGTRYWMVGANAAFASASECLDGMLRDVTVYSTALSAADLLAVYETGRGLL